MRLLFASLVIATLTAPSLAGRDVAAGLRLPRFERAKSMAARGIEFDPDCAECMAWKFAAMGRLGTARGIWSMVPQVDDMAALLDDAIALEPTRVEDAENSTLGNLHYSSAIFCRAFPDWFWLGWLLGCEATKTAPYATSTRHSPFTCASSEGYLSEQ